MTYHVTQLDILKGCTFESGSCPVARAIKRRHPHVGVLVTSGYANIGPKEYVLPERVKRFIKAFDGKEDVNPIRFEL